MWISIKLSVLIDIQEHIEEHIHMCVIVQSIMS